MNSKTSLIARITQTPGQCGGRPCIRGMRIRVTDILEMLAENVSVTEILEDFPDLELADIQACLLFAARRTDFPRLTALGALSVGELNSPRVAPEDLD
ncbi:MULTISPECIES: DUF433 domain-containing protein [unclassified Moorena]|nr:MULTISPECIES: DUF433 domain-containing protein [unclassified Moorena]